MGRSGGYGRRKTERGQRVVRPYAHVGGSAAAMFGPWPVGSEPPHRCTATSALPAGVAAGARKHLGAALARWQCRCLGHHGAARWQARFMPLAWAGFVRCHRPRQRRWRRAGAAAHCRGRGMETCTPWRGRTRCRGRRRGTMPLVKSGGAGAVADRRFRALRRATARTGCRKHRWDYFKLWNLRP